MNHPGARPARRSFGGAGLARRSSILGLIGLLAGLVPGALSTPPAGAAAASAVTAVGGPGVGTGANQLT